jgi:amino acid transporter
MSNTPELGQRRKINWLNINTVLSAAILIGAEVFGAAYAGGWAVENLTGLGSFIIGIAASIVNIVGVQLNVSPRAGVVLLQVIFFAVGTAVMIAFVRQASRVEPFTSRQ